MLWNDFERSKEKGIELDLVFHDMSNFSVHKDIGAKSQSDCFLVYGAQLQYIFKTIIISKSSSTS